MKHSVGIRWTAGALALAFCTAAMQAEAEVIYPKGGASPVRGSKITWRKSTQEYVLDADGTQITFPKARVERVEVTKPAQYDAAAKMVNDGNFAAAIPALEAIVTEYEMLQWDNKARDLLGYACLRKGDFKKAVSVYEDLFKSAPATDITPAMRRRYWDAMIGAGNYVTLVKELDNVIATASREEAAAAQLVRGDALKAQGQTLEALYDYLRVVVLYEQVKELQPEALFKAAQAMDELRDPRANDMRKRLMNDYPRSDYAQRLKGTM